MRYAWIQEHSDVWPVDRMCKVMGVSRTSYYYWLKNGSRSEDAMLLKLIQELFKSSMQSYGARRIKEALEQRYGWIVSKRRIGRIMKQLNLNPKAKKQFKITTTYSNHNLSVAPNLLEQNFDVNQPNEVYVGDITYIRTNEGWVYLAMVLDLYARTIVGWAISDRLHTPLVVEALKMARSKRTSLKNAIFHSDRGIQYVSDSYRHLLRKYGMIQSMSAKGNSYDNAVAESFFHSLKTEFVHHCSFTTQREAVSGINHYINFYNRSRLHSYNGYKSPIEKELQWWHQNQMLKIA